MDNNLKELLIIEGVTKEEDLSHANEVTKVIYANQVYKNSKENLDDK